VIRKNRTVLVPKISNVPRGTFQPAVCLRVMIMNQDHCGSGLRPSAMQAKQGDPGQNNRAEEDLGNVIVENLLIGG
jgi:hypothetical protein